MSERSCASGRRPKAYEQGRASRREGPSARTLVSKLRSPIGNPRSSRALAGKVYGNLGYLVMSRRIEVLKKGGRKTKADSEELTVAKAAAI